MSTMKKVIAMMLAGWAILTGLLAQTSMEQATFEKANQAYLAGDYSLAREEYQKIVNAGFSSAELYYNLGSTCYKLGQVPSAILYFEKALLLDPKDEDIRVNLRLANNLIVDKINPANEFFIRKWFRSFAGILSADAWAITGIFFMALLLSSGLVLYASRNQLMRRLALPVGIIAALVFAVSLLMGITQFRMSYKSGSAIVFASSLTGKSSPDQSGTDLFVIHEGLKVRILDKVGSWVRIRLADGNEAWIPESSIARI